MAYSEGDRTVGAKDGDTVIVRVVRSLEKVRPLSHALGTAVAKLER